jgi:hypothetical protein
VLELRDSKPSLADRFAARTAAWPAWRSPFVVFAFDECTTIVDVCLLG